MKERKVIVSDAIKTTKNPQNKQKISKQNNTNKKENTIWLQSTPKNKWRILSFDNDCYLYLSEKKSVIIRFLLS